MPPTVSIVILLTVGVSALIGVQVRNAKSGGTPQNKAIWSLAGWAVLTAVGVAIWLVARAQISE